MNLKIKLLSSILVLGLLAGCSSKEEVFVEPQPQETKAPENVDDKISQISSNVGMAEETIVESNNELQTNIIEENKNYNEVTSTIGDQTIVMRSIHFGFDVYTLDGENQQLSVENAKKIEEVSQTNTMFKVKVEGNCDEWGTDEYNYALGLKRANAIKKDLVRNGISTDRIVTVSYGESNPVCTMKNATCWKKNRRVDYKLVP
jgi:peptidoglycan-associated lipoprotein